MLWVERLYYCGKCMSLPLYTVMLRIVWFCCLRCCSIVEGSYLLLCIIMLRGAWFWNSRFCTSVENGYPLLCQLLCFGRRGFLNNDFVLVWKIVIYSYVKQACFEVRGFVNYEFVLLRKVSGSGKPKPLSGTRHHKVAWVFPKRARQLLECRRFR